jgi:hypothetical protein
MMRGKGIEVDSMSDRSPATSVGTATGCPGPAAYANWPRGGKQTAVA